jgi:hypothetical protein
MILVDIEHNITRRRRFTYAPTVGQKGVLQNALDVVPIGKFSFVEDEGLEGITGTGMKPAFGMDIYHVACSICCWEGPCNRLIFSHIRKDSLCFIMHYSFIFHRKGKVLKLPL